MSEETLAWRLAFVCVDHAVTSVLDARYELLSAGFGDDHPVARRLDRLAGMLASERDWCRAGVT